MPRRPASVTQADIARAIRALRAAGFPVVRVVMRDGGVIVEPAQTENGRRDTEPDVANDEGLVVL